MNQSVCTHFPYAPVPRTPALAKLLLLIFGGTVTAWSFIITPAIAQELPQLAPEVIGLQDQEMPSMALDHDTSYVAPSTPTEAPFRPLAPLPSPLMDDLALDCNYPAVTESTGTWLRRGLWYADLEGIVMTRTWNDNNVTLIGEGPTIFDRTGIRVPAGNPTGVNGQIGESSPGWDGMPRLTIGRFLFRDQRNRDHTAEMAIFGGAEWNEEVSVQSATNQRLFVPDVLHQGRTNFTGANASNFAYSSRFNSWEWNYQVNERMDKDRVELQPTGEWVRKASPGWTRQDLAGLRYFNLDESVNWFASDITPVGANTNGTYRIRTSNDMFGFQLGYGLTYEADRWNLSAGGKMGAYVNNATTSGNLAFSATDATVNDTVSQNNFATATRENTVSYFSQWDITLRYHLRPNLSLRFGWEGLYVTAAALAPNQVNFNPVSTSIGVTGDVFYNGVTFGTEYYW